MQLTSSIKAWAMALKKEVRVLALAWRDVRTPWYAKTWVLLVVVYAFSPVDLIPDFIPIIGYLDDLLLIPLGVVIAIRLIPREVLYHAREKAQDPIPSGFLKLAKLMGVLIIVSWVVIIGLSLAWFFGPN